MHLIKLIGSRIARARLHVSRQQQLNTYLLYTDVKPVD